LPIVDSSDKFPDIAEAGNPCQFFGTQGSVMKDRIIKDRVIEERPRHRG
jgi:hypothetical protein